MLQSDNKLKLLYGVVQKKVYKSIKRKSVLEIQIFGGVFLSMYSHLLKKLELSKLG